MFHKLQILIEWKIYNTISVKIIDLLKDYRYAKQVLLNI